MKKLFAILLALVMVLSLAACGGQAEAPAATEAPKAEAPAATEAPVVEDTNGDGAVKIFLVSPLIGGSAWGNCQKGFEARCAELGWEGTYLGPVTTANTAEMVELAELDGKDYVKLVKPTMEGIELTFDASIMMKEDLALFGTQREAILAQFEIVMGEKSNTNE